MNHLRYSVLNSNRAIPLFFQISVFNSTPICTENKTKNAISTFPSREKEIFDTFTVSEQGIGSSHILRIKCLLPYSMNYDKINTSE